jgi:hypothetical protein
MPPAISDSEGEDEEVLVKERPSQSSIISWAAKQIDAVAVGLFDGADERAMGSTGMLTTSRKGHSPPLCIDDPLTKNRVKHNSRPRFEMLPGDCLAPIPVRTPSHDTHLPMKFHSRTMQSHESEDLQAM